MAQPTIEQMCLNINTRPDYIPQIEDEIISRGFVKHNSGLFLREDLRDEKKQRVHQVFTPNYKLVPVERNTLLFGFNCHENYECFVEKYGNLAQEGWGISNTLMGVVTGFAGWFATLIGLLLATELDAANEVLYGRIAVGSLIGCPSIGASIGYFLDRKHTAESEHLYSIVKTSITTQSEKRYDPRIIMGL